MRQDEMLLTKAIQAVQATEPDSAQLALSSRRVADRLAIEVADNVVIDAIESCDDVRNLFPSYRAGNLSKERSLLIEAHIHDCAVCRRHFRAGSGAAAVDWSAPKQAHAFAFHPRALGWTLASALAVLVSGLFVYRAYWQIPPGVRAEVQSVEGSAFLISNAGDRPLSAGDELAEGQQVRTGGGAHAVLRLTDGSTVEVNERSVLRVGARGHNMTVALDDGAVIVQAAKRSSGHLYLKTPDCRVAVTGTVFSVDSGIKGSRVAVLQGTVDVLHAGVDTLIHAGDEVSTNDNLSSVPVEQQIAWSHDHDKYLPLLAQFAALQHRIEQIPFPQPRYTSDLLQQVPNDTLLYISIPNLGDFVSQANQIFHDQLKQSPALQQWWNQGHDQKSADLDLLIEKIHQMSQYLGDEIVVVGVKQVGVKEPANTGFAVIADVKQAGLGDFLKKQLPISGSSGPGITILDQSSLESAHASSKAHAGAFALILQNRAIFSSNIAMLKLMYAQLGSGASGFAAGDFGKQIAVAYNRGAGIIIAADLHQMISEKAALSHSALHDKKAIEKSGLDDIRYLIAEHREINGQPENHVSLQFSGTRQGAASWLASPAPIGSLQFITPNASIAVAMLSKDPKAIADDLMSMATSGKEAQKHDLTEMETELQINFREDLAATLGGDFLLALDGPMLPTPSWKAVIEVNNSQRLEQTLERLTQAIRNHAQGNAQGKQSHSLTIESSDVDGQRFYSVHDLASGTVVAQYTFANGYMIVAPTRALVMEALHTYETGDSLARSAAFRALLPKDPDENYSAVAYQNLTPVMTPLLSQFNGEAATALQQLAADARPTAICARGEDNRIEAVSDSRMFGLDFMTIETLMKIGNKHVGANVVE